VLLGIAVRHPERSRGIPLQNAQVTSRDSSTSLRSARNDTASSGRDIFRCNPYKIDNRSLFYAPSIGTDPGVADIIIEQAKAAAKS
jgi:hypothetical protein